MSQSGIIGMLTPPPGTTLFLEGDSGGQVAPNGSGVIFVLGGTNISTVGTPGSNTITINTTQTYYTVTTTDATPTLIASVTIGMGHCSTISCQFVALEDDSSTAIGGTAFTVGRNAGGGAQLSGGAGGHQSVIENTDGDPEIVFGTSGNDVQIFVVGVAARTYDWKMSLSTITV